MQPRFRNQHTDDSAKNDRNKYLYIKFAEYSFHDRALIFIVVRKCQGVRPNNLPLDVVPQYYFESLGRFNG